MPILPIYSTGLHICYNSYKIFNSFGAMYALWLYQPQLLYLPLLAPIQIHLPSIYPPFIANVFHLWHPSPSLMANPPLKAQIAFHSTNLPFTVQITFHDTHGIYLTFMSYTRLLWKMPTFHGIPLPSIETK